MTRRPDRPPLVHVISERMRATPAPERADNALVLTIFASSLVPIVGELVRPGRWGAGAVGLATVVAILSGRRLSLDLRAWLRARTGGSP